MIGSAISTVGLLFCINNCNSEKLDKGVRFMSEEHNNFRRMRELCEEPKTVENASAGCNENKTAIVNRFKCWIFGFVISCVPIFGLAIFRFLIGESSDGIWIDVLSDSEIMFISISVAVTAMYDYISSKKQFPWSYIILIILGAILFTGISIANESFSDYFNAQVAMVLNVAFIAIVLVRGIAQYIQEYWGGK